MSARSARSALFVVLALVASLRFSGDAAAAPSERERKARAHFKVGEERFKAGAFADALAEYQAGYDVMPLPGFLINVAQCQRRLGDLKTARATYQKFVLVAPDSPLVPQAKAMIAEIDGLLAELDKNKAPAAAPSEAETTPADDAAPSAAAAAPAASAPATETTAPVLVAAPASEEKPAERPRRRWWLWGALGAVVVGGAVTAIVLSTGGTTTVHDGSLATLRR